MFRLPPLELPPVNLPPLLPIPRLIPQLLPGELRVELLRRDAHTGGGREPPTQPELAREPATTRRIGGRRTDLAAGGAIGAVAAASFIVAASAVKSVAHTRASRKDEVSHRS